ncbi:hypothetical protein MKW92_031571, partial [Papaver armeniacum]
MDETTQLSNIKSQDDVRPEKLCQPFIKDPHVSQVKGRPTDKAKEKGKVSSGGRLLSHYECPNKKRKCSLCKNEGHDKRKCPDREQLNINEP